MGRGRGRGEGEGGRGEGGGGGINQASLSILKTSGIDDMCHDSKCAKTTVLTHA